MTPAPNLLLSTSLNGTLPTMTEPCRSVWPHDASTSSHKRVAVNLQHVIQASVQMNHAVDIEIPEISSVVLKPIAGCIRCPHLDARLRYASGCAQLVQDCPHYRGRYMRRQRQVPAVRCGSGTSTEQRTNVRCVRTYAVSRCSKIELIQVGPMSTRRPYYRVAFLLHV